MGGNFSKVMASLQETHGVTLCVLIGQGQG